MNIVQILQGEVRHESATLFVFRNQSLMLQLLKRLPKNAVSHPQLPGNLRLDDALAGSPNARKK